MDRDEFIKNIEGTYKRGVEIIRVKNADYGAHTNPFKNFESATVIGLGVEEAILLRTLDKMSRIGNLLHREAQVKDEAIEDTILDAINYLAILKAYRDSQHYIPCDYCEGLGQRTVSVETDRGAGEIVQEECEKCHGRGMIKK